MNHDKEFKWALPEANAAKKKWDDNSWLVIYLDVFTLMLSVFVILLGYKMHSEQTYREFTRTVYETTTQQQMEVKKADQVAKIEQQEKVKIKAEKELIQKTELEKEKEKAEVKQEFQRLLNKFDLIGSIELRVSETAVKLEIDDQILFKLGIAELSENGEDVLSKLLPILESRPGNIFIEGHTDSLPIATEQFPSNWELSTQRATTVLRFLIAEGLKAKRLRAIGFADTKPVADNATAQGRAKNRRVSIAIQTILE